MELHAVTLEIAVAWVMTRSDAFLAHLARSPDGDLDDCFSKFKGLNEGGAASYGIRMEDAWTMLRDYLLKKEKDIWGIRFERGPHINAIGVFGATYKDERVLSSHRALTSDELGNLETEVVDGELQLRPTDWVRNGGVWCKEVELEFSGIVAAFPKDGGWKPQASVSPDEPSRASAPGSLSDPETGGAVVPGPVGPTTIAPNVIVKPPAHLSSERPTASRRNRSPKKDAVRRAISELWPNGIIAWSHIPPKTLHSKIIGWFIDNIDSENKTPVDKKTIDRVLAELREADAN